MKSNLQDIDLIERFLNNEMNQQELNIFNMRLEADPSFNRLFFEINHLIDGIRYSGRHSALEEKLDKLEKSLPFKKKPENKRLTRVISIQHRLLRQKWVAAAIITPLLISSLLILHLNRTYPPSDLFSDYFTYYDNQSGGVLRGDNDQEQLQNALIFYDREEYEEALKRFDQIAVSETNKLIIWMYAGNIHLGMGNTEKAIPMFEGIIHEKKGFIMQAK
jgi:tetratricopeptide (TPR) repeat protein